MKTLGLGISALGVIAIGAFIVIRGNQAGQVAPGASLEAGYDVSKVECEEIDAARDMVNKELNDRKDTAAKALASEIEAVSNTYWETRRTLEKTKQECESEANLADPCKEAFEEISRLYQEIMDEFNDGGGFNEAKYKEREEAKKKYNECKENPPREATYAGKLEQCVAAFNSGNEAALATRAASETQAQARHDSIVKEAQAQHTSKMATLDAKEKECEDTKYERIYGSLPNTGIPVTDYQGGSPACTGVFPGYDPEIAKRISNLESLYNQAKAGGSRMGFLDASELGTEINRLKAEMAAGDAKCETDADCGGPEEVCCNISEKGRAVCSDGICTNEKTACSVDEVCGGKPAQCFGLVEVIQYKGKLILVSSIHASGTGEKGCPPRHWHGTGKTIDGETIHDPNPDSCGFGEVEKTPAFKIRGN